MGPIFSKIKIKYLGHIQLKTELGTIIVVKDWPEGIFLQWFTSFPSYHSYLQSSFMKHLKHPQSNKSYFIPIPLISVKEFYTNNQCYHQYEL